MGTTTTSEPEEFAVVTDSGTANNHIFDFSIPRGATGATGATGPAGSCPVCINAMLVAHDDVTSGDPYANFTDYQFVPNSSDVFTVNGDSIVLNRRGFYEVALNVCYEKAYGDSGAVWIQCVGRQIACTLRRLNCSDSGVTIVHTLYAAAGDELAVSFTDTAGFSQLKADITIKYIAGNDD